MVLTFSRSKCHYGGFNQKIHRFWKQSFAFCVYQVGLSSVTCHSCVTRNKRLYPSVLYAKICYIWPNLYILHVWVLYDAALTFSGMLLLDIWWMERSSSMVPHSLDFEVLLESVIDILILFSVGTVLHVPLTYVCGPNRSKKLNYETEHL